MQSGACSPAIAGAFLEQHVLIKSGDIVLSGQFATAPGGGARRQPAIAILHGFGGHRDGPQQRWSQIFFSGLGYATLRFDFRGCGDSEGKRGYVLPHDQVADTRAAVTYLANRREVDPTRIALCGTSYGAAVAVYAAAVDSRVAAVIAQGGWSNGERMFRTVHATAPQWRKFADVLVRVRERAASGAPVMTHRFDLIPVPTALRHNIDKRSIMEFFAETVLETLAFNPGDVAHRIAPRPLLILHSAKDDVIGAENALDLFRSTGRHGDLHILGGVDHFMFSEGDARVADIMKNWLKRSLPVA
jgi:pimeloyl-ACP methyl ester carboxylesterase